MQFPDFLSKRQYDVLGIDIGMSSIKFAWVRKSGASGEVKATAIKTVPRLDSGAFVDANTEFVSGIIKSAVKELNFPGKKVYLNVSGPNLYIRRISIVSMPKEDLIEAVKWTIKDQIPVELDRVILDYQIIGESKDSKGTNHINILVAIADKGFIFDCVNIIAQSNLNLMGITMFPFAVSAFNPQSALMAVLDIGAYKAEFILLNGSKPQFSRVLPGSGNDFTKAMIGVLVSDRGKFELSYDEAERLKLQIGIPQEDSPSIKPEISNAQFISMLRPVIERLENELRRSLEYCNTQLGLYTTKKIHLTGGASLLKNLDKTLTKDLGLELVYLKNKESVSFDAAIAAAMDESSCINIIPTEVKEARARKIQNIYLRMVSIISFCVLLVSYMFMNAQIYNLNKQISQANANYNAMQEVLVLKDKIDKKKSVLSQISPSRFSSATALKALSKSIPASIELDIFGRDLNSDIHIKGSVASFRPETILADFTKKMQDTNVFGKIKIVSLQKDIRQASMSNFTIYCEVSEK